MLAHRQDAQADFRPHHRWPYWFHAFAKGAMEPLLLLRLAELADLKGDLSQETSWSRWTR